MGSCVSANKKKNVKEPIISRPPDSQQKPMEEAITPIQKIESPVKSASPLQQQQQQHESLRVIESKPSLHESPKQNRIESPEPKPVSSQSSVQKNSTRANTTMLPANACCYFFGIDADNTRKIFKFDPKVEGFSPLSIPANLEVYNMSACAYVSESCIYLTGGIDPQTVKVSNKAFLYNPEQNTAQALAPFTFERYTHQAVYFKDQLYIIGGLGAEKPEAGEEQENILKSVERYDPKTKQWQKLGDLKVGRSLCISMIYQDSIYVLGGYIGETKRTRTIEKLNLQTNQWEVMTIKLPRGMESSFVCSPGPDQLQIIGGQDASGCVSINYIYNLLEDIYQPKRPMNQERVLHKGFVSKEKIYIFGGDDNDTMEEYNMSQDRWEKVPSTFRSLVNGVKLFSYSQPALFVDHDPAAKPQQDLSPDLKSKKCYVFGDNNNSFILEINFTRDQVRERPIPTNLKMFGYQGAVALPDGNYFLCGGINKQTKTISTKAYLYNPRNNTAKKLPKCQDARYTFNLVAMDNYVYAIGGRTWEEDNQTILDSCERYSLAKNTWERIAKLNHARCSAMTFQLKNKIYILGGYKGQAQRWADIELYHPELNSWEILKVELKVALEGSSLVMANRRGGIFLLGGRTDDGDTDKIWEFDVEQGDMWEVGNLKEPKSLNKVFEFQERKVLILGGDKAIAELFDLREGKPIAESALVTQINQNLKARVVNQGKDENKLLRFSLA